MNSFYGGREGAPFILRKSYPDVPTMLADFEKGLAFTEVRFGEYVIINTKSKNHPDNGKIFRRNFAGGKIKYWEIHKDGVGNEIFKELTDADAEPAHGAELIGSIVGPAGSAPYFQAVPFKLNEDDDTPITMQNIRKQYENEFFDTRRSWGSFNLTDKNLVPGVYYEEEENGELKKKFNDDIIWDSFSVRTPDADDATAFIEFRVPYKVIDFEANQIDAYTPPTVEEMSEDGKVHPFYQKWQINIPKGLKGASISNIRTEVASENIVTLSQGENGELIINRYEENVSEAYEGQQEDIANGYEIFVADITYYDNKEEGETYPVYVGDYNEIKTNLSLDNTLQIFGSHQPDTEIKLKTPNKLYTEEDGTFKVDYNTGETATLGGFFYQGDSEEEATKVLTEGGLWIHVVEV